MFSKGTTELKRINGWIGSQLSWYLCVALPNELTPLMKTKFERVCFLTKSENQCIYKITFPRISKQPTIHKNWSPLNLPIQKYILLLNVFCVLVTPSKWLAWVILPLHLLNFLIGYFTLLPLQNIFCRYVLLFPFLNILCWYCSPSNLF